MRKWVTVLIIIILVAGGSTTGIAFADKARQLDAANFTIADLADTVEGLESDVSNLELDKALLQQDKSNLTATLEAVNSDLDSAEDRIISLSSDLRATELKHATMSNKYETTKSELEELTAFYDGIFKGKAPPYVRTDGNFHNVVDNGYASDVTWGELVDFLRNDQTDRHRYISDEYDCSEFAEDLHNNAEAAGIRSALVFIDFEDSEVGHALNAFNTTDRGLVFIDNTGSSSVTTQSWDRIAYILIGERYGALTLDTDVESFEYGFYADFCEQLEQRITSYESRVSAHNANVASYNAAVQAYNAEVEEYEKAVEAYNQNPTHSEYLRLVAWFDELLAQEQWLDAWTQQIHISYLSLSQEFIELGFQRDSLGGILGTVKEVEMYW